MTVGVQADRLYVGDTLVWDASAHGASGVPSAVAFDCDNFSASSAVLAWGPLDVLPGDVLVMAVMDRAGLVVPDGWTLHSTIGAVTPGYIQSTSILTRRYTTGGTVSGTVTQAAPERMQVGIVNMRGVASVVSRPDLTAVVSKPFTDTVTVPGKARPGVVMWALSCRFWNTDTYYEDLPYISGTVRPWSASPGMWAPEWTPSAENSDNSRLGMFLDVSDPGPRTFANGEPTADDAVPIVAVELVGT